MIKIVSVSAMNREVILYQNIHAIVHEAVFGGCVLTKNWIYAYEL